MHSSLVISLHYNDTRQMEDSKDEQDWLATITHWEPIKDFWVEKLWPHLRDNLGVKAMGVVGTGWGAYIATRLSSYEEFLACVNLEPLISTAVEAAKEDLYEVYEEVRCPTYIGNAPCDCVAASDGLDFTCSSEVTKLSDIRAVVSAARFAIKTLVVTRLDPNATYIRERTFANGMFFISLANFLTLYPFLMIFGLLLHWFL